MGAVTGAPRARAARGADFGNGQSRRVGVAGLCVRRVGVVLAGVGLLGTMTATLPAGGSAGLARADAVTIDDGQGLHPAQVAPSTSPIGGARDHNAADPETAGRGVVHPEVERRLQGAPEGRRVEVIVSLDVRRRGAAHRPAEVHSAGGEVIKDLPRGSYAVRARFDRLPALSMSVDAAALRALERNPRVTAVNEDHTISLEMAEANALTNVPPVHDGGITGDGVAVAVIDSGVDSNAGVVHPGLADDLLGQACFRTEGDCIGGTGSAEDQNGHGTHVAGIITGPEGVAPDAGFYALKVFRTVSTSDTNVLDALDHVISLNDTTPGAVDLVNMSLGGRSYQTQTACDSANAAYLTAFSTLNAQGTTTFVATGNDALTNAVDAPACVSGAVGVGSVGDGVHTIGFDNCHDRGAADKVTCFSNTTPVQGDGELVDLLAPGCRISSTWLNGGMNTICGTSMATPFAAGVAALVLEIAARSSTAMTPAQLEALLEDAAEQTSDYRLPPGSPTFPRVHAAAAVGMTIDAPTNVQAVAASATSVSVTWDGVPGADDYRVYRTSNTENDQLVDITVAHSLLDDSAPCGPLTYIVRTSRDGLASLSSEPATVQVRACPAAPTGLALTPTSLTSHQLTWVDDNTDETSLVLQRRLAGEGFSDLATFSAGTNFSTTDTVTECGVGVEYRVMSVRDGDRSLPSDVVRRVMCAPTNDDLADAEVVTQGLPGTSSSDTEGKVPLATREASDPAFPCKAKGSGPGHHTIWYAITPTAPVDVTIDTAGSTLDVPGSGGPDTLLAVYRGTPSVLTQVVCNEDISGSDYRSRATVNLTTGHTYYVQVAQWSEVPQAQPGDVVTKFSWAEPPSVPPNDEWESAAAIDATPYTLSVTDAQLATLSGADPPHPCRFGGAGTGNHTLWWTFTPEFDGALDLDTLSSTGAFTNTILSVWTGEPGSFTNVACNDDATTSNLRSRLVDVPVVAQTTYSILVSRWDAAPTTSAGTVVLTADYRPDSTGDVVAADDAFSTHEDTTLTVAAPGVLGNDTTSTPAATLTADLVSGPANGTLTLGTDGSFDYTPNVDFHGTDSFDYGASDGGETDTATVTITVDPVNDAPAIVSVSPAGQTVHHSDRVVPVTVTATDVDGDVLALSTSGLPDGVAASSATCTDPGVTPSQCSWTLSGAVDSPAGAFPATVRVSDGDLSDQRMVTFTVETEDAIVSPAQTNPVAVQVAAPGGASGAFTLSATVAERAPDQAAGSPLAGDVSTANVSMTLVPVGPGSPVGPIECTTTGVTGTAYDQRLTTACDLTGVPVNTYTVQTVVDGGYWTGSGEDVLTVFDPSLGSATGGGTFIWPDTADPDTGDAGDRTNVGFTMSYTKKGTNLRGSLLVIRHLPDGSTYRIKSNALDGLAVGEDPSVPMGWASFSGKATYLQPGWDEPEGNHAFSVYVEDRNQSGAGTDRFWLTTRDKDGATIDALSLDAPATSNAQPLTGGNIIVPHGTKGGRTR